MLRARVMSFFELSLLAGLTLGGLVGSQLWHAVGRGAFAVLAGVYLLAGALLLSIRSRPSADGRAALRGLARAVREPSLRRLAPIWLCVNAIIGLWIGPTFYFLLTRDSTRSQLLAGLLADRPQALGWVLLGYTGVFGAGLLAWSALLPRLSLTTAMRISLGAMLTVSTGLLALNHAAGAPIGVRWAITAALALLVMVESGFTPAALAMLAGVVGARAGRGAAMGVYSVLLALGALSGSLLAAVVADRFAVDGLIYATLGLAVLALLLVSGVHDIQRETARIAPEGER
jgi:hypothetical protein